MALSDLMDRLGLGEESQDDDGPSGIPDDLSELDQDEPEDDLPADPKPVRKAGVPNLTGSPGKATAAEKRQVRDALSLLIKGPAALVNLRDPHCGGAMLAQSDKTIKALVPIVCRNPAMLGWFTAVNAPFLDLAALIQALAPVGAMFINHHVRHTVGDQVEANKDDLSAYAVPAF